MGALVAISEGIKKGRLNQQVCAGQYLQLQEEENEEEEKGNITSPLGSRLSQSSLLSCSGTGNKDQEAGTTRQ